ncbi:hypothetical protein [Bradyrhizobium genosp. A]|uniref:hypothetical protein n=1 Tax=Bradyrhizobium genosp. A TaxID=83626 RepID=UPI003CEDE7CB
MSYEMSSDETSSDQSSNHLDQCSRRRIAGFDGRTRSPRDSVAKPLDLARDENLANALRRCEDAFNEDVLPLDARLREPREFYAAVDMGCLPRNQKQARLKQTLPARRQRPMRMPLLDGPATAEA